MKIIVFGANGKTGSLLVKQALDKGYQVIAYVRQHQTILADHPNLKVVVGHLNETLKLKDALTGVNACFSTLGGNSLIRRSTEITTGISNIIEAMEQANVHRFIYMSSIGAGESRFIMNPLIRFLVVNVILRVPLADHNANERLIASSNLSWTVVRPFSLTDGPKTGNFNHGTTKTHIKANKKISRANVAEFMLEQLAHETYLKKFVWLYE